MKINLTGFKATTEIKSSSAISVDQPDLKFSLQAIASKIQIDKNVPKFWSMVRYNDTGKHNNQSVEGLTGIILEYEKHYEADLLNALLRLDLPWHYLLVETERKSGQYLSLFFPLAFEPDVSKYMRIAGVLAYQLGVYGLSAGSGTPTFLVKIVGGQNVGEHPGAAIGQSFINETANIGDDSKTALDDFQGPKPVKQVIAIDPSTNPTSVAVVTQGKEKQIAAHFRTLADLFDPD